MAQAKKVKVKTTFPMLIGGKHTPKGTIVELEESEANYLVSMNRATKKLTGGKEEEGDEGGEGGKSGDDSKK